MKLTIEIDEEVYERALNRELMFPRDLTRFEKIIANGKPLPKGHGRLIDADALNRKDVNCVNVPMNFIDNAPTIIEADRESRMRIDEFPNIDELVYKKIINRVSIIDEYVNQEINRVLEDIKAEIRHFMLDVNPSSSESDYACNYIIEVIKRYKEEGA